MGCIFNVFYQCLIDYLSHYPKTFILLFFSSSLYWVYLKLLVGPKCPEDQLISGQVVVITGANCGIGKETAKDLVKRGGHVILACRDTNKAHEAMLDIQKYNYSGTCEVLPLDLQSVESIYNFVNIFKEKYMVLNILINNAGVALCDKGTTMEGFELHFGINHLGHFLLTLLLLDTLIDSGSARVINVSSLLHKRTVINLADPNMDQNYNSFKAYCHSKRANVYFTQELAKRFPHVFTFAVNPGPVNTQLSRHIKIGLQSVYNFFGFIFYKTPAEGARTVIYCAVMKGLGKNSGKYFSNCAVEELPEIAKDTDTSERLWDLSVKMLKIEKLAVAHRTQH